MTRTGSAGVIPVCCTPSSTEKASIEELFQLLNEYRASKGKPELTYDPNLEAAVQGHCQHMITRDFWDHTAPEDVVSSPSKRAALCGTTAQGENLADGQRSPEAVMSSWKGSAGHNNNMLGNWKRVGLCRAGSFWGQLFGN